MDKISVALMGTPYVKLNNELVHFRYKKAEALFFYLCLKKMITRDEAIRMFWGESEEKSARDRLRDLIYSIKKVLGEKTILTVGNSIIKLDPLCQITVDTDNLTKDTIADLYEGDFLDCFFVKNCLEFEEWVGDVRARYKELYISSLKSGLRDKITARDIDGLQRYISLIIDNNPYDEQVCRDMMEIYISLGYYNHASQLYSKLYDVLENELQEKPERETTAMFETLVELKERKSHSENIRKDYFFGRGGEIHQAMAQLDRLYDGVGGSVMIIGEPGIGKSAFLEELKRRVNKLNFIVLSRTCYQAEQELHLTPWYDILTQISDYVGDEKDNVPTHDQVMNLLFPCLGDSCKNINTVSDSWLALTTEAVINAISPCLGNKKILLVFDDIQWMDTASRRLLSSVMIKQGGKALALLTSCRDYCVESISDLLIPLEQADIMKKIMLDRFSCEETGVIVSECLPELSGQIDVVRRIYRDTEGNALFLVELLQLIGEKGYTDQLPSKVTNIIKGRLLDLNDHEREVLCAASLFFDKVSLNSLQICCSYPELELCNIIESLLKRRLIKEELSGNKVFYRFTHQKIRDFIHNMQSAGKRKLLHKRLAEYFESVYLQSPRFHLCSQLIYHFDQCGDIYKTYTYKIEYLMEFYSVYHETYPYVAHDFEDICSMGGELADNGGLIKLAEEIRSLSSDDPRARALKMKTEFVLGRYYIRLGDYENGLRCIKSSIDYAKIANDNMSLINNYKQMIYYSIQVHDLNSMEYYLETAMEALNNIPENVQERCLLMRLKGLFLIQKSRYKEAETCILEAISLIQTCCIQKSVEQIFLSVCYNYIGECYFFQKDYESAYNYFYKAIETCKKQRLTSGIGVFYTYAGESLYELGHYSESKEYITKAIDCFDRLHAIWGKASAEAYASLLEMKIGTLKKACEHYEIARRFAKQLGNPPVIKLVDSVGEQLMKRTKLRSYI